MTTQVSDEEYFGEMKIMFQTKGWDILKQELFNNAQVINDVQATKDNDNLNFRKGQLATLAFLLNLEETLKKTEEEKEESEYTATE